MTPCYYKVKPSLGGPPHVDFTEVNYSRNFTNATTLDMGFTSGVRIKNLMSLNLVFSILRDDRI